MYDDKFKIKAVMKYYEVLKDGETRIGCEIIVSIAKLCRVLKVNRATLDRWESEFLRDALKKYYKERESK